MSTRPEALAAGATSSPGGAWATWCAHWPEYAMEAWALGTFMVSAAAFTTLLEYPESPLRQAIANADVRRALNGLAMGTTAVALVHSPWGRRSGAHMNPAVTLAFYLLGRIRAADAVAYAAAQFAGGLLGVLFAAVLLGSAFTAAPVAWVATVPGSGGAGVALIAEAAISFVLFAVLLAMGARERLAPYAGVAAGVLVALYIAVEAPLSGMSMNPARTLASAAPPGLWSDLWLYFAGPCAGMAAAAALHRLLEHGRGCAKLVHDPRVRCIHCGHEPARSMRP